MNFERSSSDHASNIAQKYWTVGELAV